MQSAKITTQQEHVLESADLVNYKQELIHTIVIHGVYFLFWKSLRKMQVLLTHLGYQYESIENNAKAFADVKEQSQGMQE